MTRDLPEFVRLPDGRLWHVRLGWATACGRVIDMPAMGVGEKQPEELQGVVPTGAWVCTRCRATLADWLAAVNLAIKADPRTRRDEPLPDDVDVDAFRTLDQQAAAYAKYKGWDPEVASVPAVTRDDLPTLPFGGL